MAKKALSRHFRHFCKSHKIFQKNGRQNFSKDSTSRTTGLLIAPTAEAQLPIERGGDFLNNRNELPELVLKFIKLKIYIK